MNTPLSDGPAPEMSPQAPPSGLAVTPTRMLDILSSGPMDIQGLLPYSSNYNFLITVGEGEIQAPAVYKPRRGESPLWDFARGTLCLRERAAYLVSQALGWDLVPPTVLRKGHHGLGSVQFYVDASPEDHYFTVREDARYAHPLRRLALFDVAINNADRKSGHCLIDPQGRLWAIDHGICFHQEHKLRTVIWEFAGQPIAPPLLADLDRLCVMLTEGVDPIAQELAHLLDSEEFFALRERLAQLTMAATYPIPLPHRRNFPWPPI